MSGSPPVIAPVASPTADRTQQQAILLQYFSEAVYDRNLVRAHIAPIVWRRVGPIFTRQVVYLDSLAIQAEDGPLPVDVFTAALNEMQAWRVRILPFVRQATAASQPIITVTPL